MTDNQIYYGCYVEIDKDNIYRIKSARTGTNKDLPQRLLIGFSDKAEAIQALHRCYGEAR